MFPPESLYFFASLAAAMATIAVLALAPGNGDSPASPQPLLSRPWIFFFCALVLAANIARAYWAQAAFNGVFTPPDENSFSRIYIAELFSNRPVYGGPSQAVLALLYGAWYWLAGCCSVIDARLFSFVLHSAGLAAVFFLVRRERCAGTALLTVLFLSLSPLFLLFSSLAIETGSVFLFLPLVLLAFSRKEKNFTERGMDSGTFLAASVFTGVTLGAAVFTYPGTILYLLCLAAAFFLTRLRASWDFWQRRDNLIALGSAVLFGAIVFAVYFFSRDLSQSTDYPLRATTLLGTGAVALEPWKIADAFFTCLRDLLTGGDSLYFSRLPYAAFLEPALWGLFLLGAYFERKNPKHRALLISLGLALLLCCFITNMPGLRRALAALPVAHYFCAVGAMALFRNSSARFAARGVFGFSLLCISFSTLILPSRHIEKAWLGNTPPIPDGAIQRVLRLGDVFLDVNRFDFDTSGLDAYASLGLARLEAKFGAPRINKTGQELSTEPGRVFLLKGTSGNFVGGKKQPQSPCAMFFAWKNIGGELPDALFWDRFGYVIVSSGEFTPYAGKTVLEQALTSKDPQRKILCE